MSSVMERWQRVPGRRLKVAAGQWIWALSMPWWLPFPNDLSVVAYGTYLLGASLWLIDVVVAEGK